jgi:molecular chaperone DnaJ
MSKDFYEVLGVSANATDDEIKKAYRALARQHHPDANNNDPHSAERFKELNEAYETLRDPERRRRYDMFGADGANAGAGSPFGAGQFGLNDLFDAFFSGGDMFGGGRRGAGPQRGQDAEVALDLTLEDVVFGSRKTLELHMPVECDTCHGSGCAPGTHPDSCRVCDGTGEVRQMRRSLLGQLMTASPCTNCGGTGQAIPDPCPSCRGTGQVNSARSIDVEVPKGIDDGQRLRLSGRGPAAPRGGPAGDLYVMVRVRPDPNFERRGDDLWHTHTVSIAQATLGTQLEIDTLDGPQPLDIPAGTQPGAVQRIRGLGVPSLRSGRRGDLNIEVRVVVPTNLKNEEADLLAQFAQLRGEHIAPHRDGLFSRLRSSFKQ